MKNILAICPICDAQLSLPDDTQVSEVVMCNDCKTQLVVESLLANKARLAQAPTIEEDWGE